MWMFLQEKDFEIDINYPENKIRKDLRLEYIVSKDDKKIAQSSVLKAIEAQASFVDFIVIPKNAETGMHIIDVKIFDYEDLKKDVSASFHVINDKSSQLRKYFFILLFSVITIGCLVAFEIYKLSKLRGNLNKSNRE